MTAQALRDVLEVGDRVLAYARAVDRKRLDQVAECFTPDCAYEGALGTGTITDALATLAGAFERYTTTMHFMGTQNVTCDGDTARTVTYCIAYHVRHDGRHLTAGVRYCDDLVRTTDGWRIARRVVRTDWSRDDAASGGA